MSEMILHVLKGMPGIQEMGRDRVAKTVTVALMERNVCLLGIHTKQPIDTLAAHRPRVARRKKIRQGISPISDIVAQKPQILGGHDFLPSHATLQSRNVNLARCEVDVLAP